MCTVNERRRTQKKNCASKERNVHELQCWRTTDRASKCSEADRCPDTSHSLLTTHTETRNEMNVVTFYTLFCFNKIINLVWIRTHAFVLILYFMRIVNTIFLPFHIQSSSRFFSRYSFLVSDTCARASRPPQTDGQTDRQIGLLSTFAF